MNAHALVIPASALACESPWTMSELTNLYSGLESQITPFNGVLTITGDVFRAFDERAKTFIANAFMQHTQEVVMFCRDGTGQDRYFLGAPRIFLEDDGVIMDVVGSEPFWFPRLDEVHMTQVSAAAKTYPSVPKAKEQKKIPRPPNPFILYRKERHHLVKEANPGITNNEISQVLGTAWNCESREIRQKYQTMSKEIKQALLDEHPDYQYRPRKPFEKKKRQRRATMSLSNASATGGDLPEASSSGAA